MDSQAHSSSDPIGSDHRIVCVCKVQVKREDKEASTQAQT